MAFDLGDYVEVSERIKEFREKHPQGSLQSEIVELPAAFAEKFLAVKAFAFRSPDDPRPGVGIAWEPVPGKTSYTKDSELQNAETSAWGRAIVAALAADTRAGIASADEVRARQAPSKASQKAQKPPPPQKLSEAQKKALFALSGELSLSDEQRHAASQGKSWADLSKVEAAKLIDHLQKQVNSGNGVAYTPPAASPSPRASGTEIAGGPEGPSLSKLHKDHPWLASLPEDVQTWMLDEFRGWNTAEAWVRKWAEAEGMIDTIPEVPPSKVAALVEAARKRS